MLTACDIEAVPFEEEATTVIGDVDAFIEYVESGQARKEWNEKILAVEKGFDEYVKVHPRVWHHIVLIFAQLPPHVETKTKRHR